MDQTEVWRRTRSELREVSINTKPGGWGAWGQGVMVWAIELRAGSPVEMRPEQKWVEAGIGYSLGHFKDQMRGMNGWCVVLKDQQ